MVYGVAEAHWRVLPPWLWILAALYIHDNGRVPVLRCSEF